MSSTTTTEVTTLVRADSPLEMTVILAEGPDGWTVTAGPHQSGPADEAHAREHYARQIAERAAVGWKVDSTTTPCGMAWGSCEEGHAHDCGASLTAESREHAHRCRFCGETAEVTA